MCAVCVYMCVCVRPYVHRVSVTDHEDQCVLAKSALCGDMATIFMCPDTCLHSGYYIGEIPCECCVSSIWRSVWWNMMQLVVSVCVCALL